MDDLGVSPLKETPTCKVETLGGVSLDFWVEEMGSFNRFMGCFWFGKKVSLQWKCQNWNFTE